MKKAVLTYIILLSAAISVIAQAPVTTGDLMSEADIQFDKTVHDYGNVNTGADGHCEFTFTNTGTGPLYLTDVKASCGCTVPEWTKDTLQPGKTGTIKVNYTKMNTPGGINKQISVFSNAKSGSVVLFIKGTVLDTPENKSSEEVINNGGDPPNK